MVGNTRSAHTGLALFGRAHIDHQIVRCSGHADVAVFFHQKYFLSRGRFLSSLRILSRVSRREAKTQHQQTSHLEKFPHSLERFKIVQH